MTSYYGCKQPRPVSPSCLPGRFAPRENKRPATTGCGHAPPHTQQKNGRVIAYPITRPFFIIKSKSFPRKRESRIEAGTPEALHAKHEAAPRPRSAFFIPALDSPPRRRARLSTLIPDSRFRGNDKLQRRGQACFVSASCLPGVAGQRERRGGRYCSRTF